MPRDVGDVVSWHGDEWKVTGLSDGGVSLLRHETGAFSTAVEGVPVSEVTLVRRRDEDRVCMGSNFRWGCYRPLSECECGEAS